MHKKLSFHRWLIILWLKSSLGSNVTNERCYQYEDCWTCVGDPCSRRKEAQDVGNICVWCYNYLDVGSRCISTRRDRDCLSQPIKHAAQCQLEPNTRALTEPSLKPFVTQNFIAHLEYLRSDIVGTIQADVGFQNFNVWLAINRSVSSRSVVDKCGRYSPISAIEMNDMYALPRSPSIGNRDRCWNLGQVTSTPPTLLDMYNSQKGIVLDFGTSPCCSSSRNTTYVKISVLLIKGYCLHDSLNSSVISGNIAMLTNCSESNNSLQFVVQTSVLCPSQLEWRLSENTTALCAKLKSDEYKCTIDLKAAVSDAAISLSSLYCQKYFFLWKRFSNGSEVVTSLIELPPKEDIGDCCNFVVEMHDLCTLSVYYKYPFATPQLILINGFASVELRSCSTIDVSWVEVAIIILFCFILSSLMTFFSVIRKRHSNFEHQLVNSKKHSLNSRSQEKIHKSRPLISADDVSNTGAIPSRRNDSTDAGTTCQQNSVDLSTDRDAGVSASTSDRQEGSDRLMDNSQNYSDANGKEQEIGFAGDSNSTTKRESNSNTTAISNAEICHHSASAPKQILTDADDGQALFQVNAKVEKLEAFLRTMDTTINCNMSSMQSQLTDINCALENRHGSDNDT